MATIYCDNAGITTANCGETLSLWLSPLQARLAGATLSIITCELRAAIREFYYQSRGWREQFGPYAVTANNDLIWLNPVDAYSNVVHVHNAWIEDPVRGRQDLKKLTIRPTDGMVDYPTHFQAADPSVLRLWPEPDESLGQVLWVDASLTPAPDATRLPNVAASHHFEAILEGALSRLYGMMNKPWSNPDMSLMLARSFRRRYLEFRALSDQGHLMADKGWRFPSFA